MRTKFYGVVVSLVFLSVELWAADVAERPAKEKSVVAAVSEKRSTAVPTSVASKTIVDNALPEQMFNAAYKSALEGFGDEKPKPESDLLKTSAILLLNSFLNITALDSSKTHSHAQINAAALALSHYVTEQFYLFISKGVSAVELQQKKIEIQKKVEIAALIAGIQGTAQVQAPVPLIDLNQITEDGSSSRGGLKSAICKMARAKNCKTFKGFMRFAKECDPETIQNCIKAFLKGGEVEGSEKDPKFAQSATVKHDQCKTDGGVQTCPSSAITKVDPTSTVEKYVESQYLLRLWENDQKKSLGKKVKGLQQKQKAVLKQVIEEQKKALVKFKKKQQEEIFLYKLFHDWEAFKKMQKKIVDMTAKFVTLGEKEKKTLEKYKVWEKAILNQKDAALRTWWESSQTSVDVGKRIPLPPLLEVKTADQQVLDVCKSDILSAAPKALQLKRSGDSFNPASCLWSVAGKVKTKTAVDDCKKDENMAKLLYTIDSLGVCNIGSDSKPQGE